MDNWVKDTIVVHTICHLDWRDRFRVLFSGLISVRTFTDVSARCDRHNTWQAVVQCGVQQPPKDLGIGDVAAQGAPNAGGEERE